MRFAPHARRHLSAIAQYICTHNPAAARRVRSRIRETAELLERFSHIGHPGAAPGTREVVVPHLPYIIVHTVEANGALFIVGIYHGA